MNQASKPMRSVHFIIFLLVAFINALVDLGHKITIQNTIFKIYDDQQQVILTAIINALILLPFVFSFSLAGHISDRFAKPKVMQLSALMAIILSSVITFSYYHGLFLLAFGMTFLLALQSAVYSPAKYGYIRELLGDDKLAFGNGATQATSIVAILTGIVLFSVGFELLLEPNLYETESQILSLVAPLGWLLIGLSLLEFSLTLNLPQLATQQNVDRLVWSNYMRGDLLKKNLVLLRSSPKLWLTILGLSLFWGVSQTLLATFPAFAKITLHETNTVIIQGLLACAGLGIIIGSFLGGRLTDSCFKQLIIIGALGQIMTLIILPQLTSSLSFAVIICLFGLFGGLFIVPLNTYIQRQAPQHKLGTILAGNNWFQNIVMLSFLAFTLIAALLNVTSALILISLPVILILFFLLLSVKISDI